MKLLGVKSFSPACDERDLSRRRLDGPWRATLPAFGRNEYGPRADVSGGRLKVVMSSDDFTRGGLSSRRTKRLRTEIREAVRRWGMP